MFRNRNNLSKDYGPPSKLRKLRNVSLVMDKSQSNDDLKVNVFVRVRPENEKEKCENFRNVVKVVDEKLLVFDPQEEQQPFFFRGTKQKVRDIAKKQNKELEFLFDGVFGPDVCNWDIHCKTTHNIIASLLEGYNCSVFVYGATGAGKTFTMLGKREHSPGIMYHTMAELYQQIESLSQEKECHVGVSFVEVYNENVFDLLNPSGPLFLREDASGVTIVGLKVENISNADQLLEKLAHGNNNRTQHPTDANAESSRSHAVFQVYIRMTALNDGQVKISKLSMIDLAGSERGMATGCKGVRFKEGSNINKSLLALGNCISSLADNLRHVPYRDSKLTRLLKDSLGGNCRTLMIANISPSSASYEDTYNTLKFASRAKKITTKLTKNILSSDMRISHYMKLVEKLETENTLLKSKVRAFEMIATDSARACSQTPDTSVWSNHLDTLLDEKIELCKRLLNCKSEACLLQWRIKYKNSVKEVLKKSSCILKSQDCFGRIEMSLRRFEGRLIGLQCCMNELEAQLKDNSDKIGKLIIEMEEARVIRHMKKDFDLKNALLQKTIQEVNNKHLLRLLSLQQRRAESCEKALAMQEPLLNTYFKLLSGLSLMTQSMATEHENAVSQIEGIKTVQWCDIASEEFESGSSNLLSAVNLSFDESLFTIDHQHEVPKLKPIVLPIMDIKDDESADSVQNNDQIVDSVKNDKTDHKEKDNDEAKVLLEENSVLPVSNNVTENVEIEDEENTANSTITLETPSISLADLPQCSDNMLSSLTNTCQPNYSVKSSCLNETVTIGTESADNEKKEKIFTSKLAKAMKNLPGSRMPLSKERTDCLLQKNDKENILIKKNFGKNGSNEKCTISDFKKTLIKTQALNRYQQNETKTSLARRALRTKSVNSMTSEFAITPSLKSQVPSTQTLKITNSKNRITSHPYKRPGKKSIVADKRR